MFRSIRNAFITGVIVVLPLGVTLMVINFLLEKLGQYPSLYLLKEGMQMAARHHSRENQMLEKGTEVLGRFFDNSPNYRCENCGFELKNLHWACPGCNRWGVVHPLDSQIPFTPEHASEAKRETT